jgi:hypothetical protein
LALATTDGSYKKGLGVAAWVLEGEAHSVQITGTTPVSGDAIDQSAYRIVLIGILAVLSMIRGICHFLKLDSGAITIGCDSTSALLSRTNHYKDINTRMPDHDLLFAIQHTIAGILNTLQWLHVRGHQDNKKGKDEMTRAEQFNCEMDKAAKDAVATLSRPPPSREIEGEPWWVCIQSRKLIKHRDTLVYEHIHSPKVQLYWKNKGKTGSDPLDINWDAIQAAFRESRCQLQWFITKHSTGMCGVGKFLLRWKRNVPIALIAVCTRTPVS